MHLKPPEQIEADNEAWWASHASDFPFAAASSLAADNQFVMDFPEAVYLPFGRFVACPFPVAQKVRWGFQSAAARDAFIAAVGAGLLPFKTAVEYATGKTDPEPDPFDIF